MRFDEREKKKHNDEQSAEKLMTKLKKKMMRQSMGGCNEFLSFLM